MVRGEAAVAGGVPAVAVGEGNGVPAVVGGGEVIANDTTGGEAAIADGVPTVVVRGEAAVADGVPAVAVGEGNDVPAVAGGGEAISNDTTGDVGGADAVGAAVHPQTLAERRDDCCLCCCCPVESSSWASIRVLVHQGITK